MGVTKFYRGILIFKKYIYIKIINKNVKRYLKNVLEVKSLER